MLAEKVNPGAWCAAAARKLVAGREKLMTKGSGFDDDFPQISLDFMRGNGRKKTECRRCERAVNAERINFPGPISSALSQGSWTVPIFFEKILPGIDPRAVAV